MKIKVYGAFDSLTGYGEVSRQIVLALADIKQDLCLQPQNWGYCRAELQSQVYERIKKMRNNRDDHDVILFINPPQFFKKKNNPAIGLTMTETDGFPKEWVGYCNTMDRVLVPSLFNYEAFKKSGVNETKLRILPLGVNSEFFNDKGPKYPIKLDRQTFIFLSLGEWVPRKGFDILIKAFAQEFSGADPVCLVLKTYANSSDYDPSGTRIQHEIDKLRAEKKTNAPQVYLLPAALSDIEIPSLYRSADCFVQATRGEGWNMPVFEALACGIPVITTKWSSHTNYLDDATAYLIEIEGLEAVPPGGTPLDKVYQGFKWAIPSQEHLRQLMRMVYENHASAKAKAKEGQKYVRLNLGWQRCAQGIVEVCSELF